jgi:hypothetical protein
VDLRRLVEESPGAFVVWPDPYRERREERRRFPIQLVAWATEIAGELKAKYGEVVVEQPACAGLDWYGFGST